MRQEGEAGASGKAPPQAAIGACVLFGASIAARRRSAPRCPPAAAALPDGRGWEMVSPVDKNGGAITAAGSVAGGGVLQAAADGDSVTYSSASLLRRRSPERPAGQPVPLDPRRCGWSTENLTVPIFSGSYGADARTASPTSSSRPTSAAGCCSTAATAAPRKAACPVANPPLPGTDAPGRLPELLPARTRLGFEALLGDGDVDERSTFGPANSSSPSPAPRPTSATSSSRPARRSPPAPPKCRSAGLRPRQPEPLRVVRGGRR